MILVNMETQYGFGSGRTVNVTLRSSLSTIIFETTRGKAEVLLKMTHDQIEKIFTDFEESIK